MTRHEKLPKVSVILTSYNHEKYLRDSIESVLNQTFLDFELIIWDDGSIDRSWEIIQSYADEKIRIYQNAPEKRGYPIKRILEELQLPRGEYVAIHHSDDVWEPDKLEKQVAFLDSNPEIGAVFTWAKIIDEKGNAFENKDHFYYKIFEQPNRTRQEWLNYFFYTGNALCHSSVLIRKEIYEEVGLYRYGMAQLPDFDMWVRLALKYEIHVMPEKLVRFRIWRNEANSSGDRPETHVRSQFEYLQLLNNYRKISSFEELVKIFPKAEEYERNGEEYLGFVLGMMAVNAGTHSFTELFGLTLLFEALNDVVGAKKIKELYNFTHLNFIELTAQHDVFSVETIRNLYTQLAERDTQLAERDAQLAERDAQLAERNAQLAERDARLAERDAELYGIKISKAWRLVCFLRKVRILLIPPGSLRAKIARRIAAYILFPLRAYKKNQIKRSLQQIRDAEFFDEGWYLTQYPDVGETGTDPAEHYFLYGWKEGRDPSLHFSTVGYLDAYPDVRQSGVNPLVHFLKYGINEESLVVSDTNSKKKMIKLQFSIKRALTVWRQYGFFVMFRKALTKIQYVAVNSFLQEGVDNVIPDISIVIPVYNALAMTQACLSSVYEEKPEEYRLEIIIIDNASKDDTNLWVRRYQKKHPDLIYLRMEENIGFGPAVNKGIHHSQGKYVVVLNNDTIVSSGWLEKLLAVLKTDRSVGIVSPMTNYVGEGLQIDIDAIELPPDTIAINNYATEIAQRTQIIYEPNRLVFFCVMIRREVIDLVGGLDEGYQMGNFEDDDYCLRTRMVGYKLAIAKDAFVYHHGSVTFKKNKISHNHWMENNRRRFYYKVGRVATILSAQLYLSPRYERKLSVIVRTKNRRRLLENALTSLTNQTFRDFEVVIVNDGGEDVSSLLMIFEDSFPITYINNIKSEGRTAAINSGLRQAKGDWIAYLDDDDILYPWHFESLFQKAETSDGKVIYSDFNYTLFASSDSSRPIRLIGAPSWEYERSKFLVTNYLPIHSYIHLRQSVEEVGYWDESLDRLEDYDFLMRLNALYDFFHVPKVTCEYRFYLDANNSISTGRVGYLSALKQLYAQYPVTDDRLKSERQQVLDGLERQTRKIEALLKNMGSTNEERLAVQREIVRLTTGM